MILDVIIQSGSFVEYNSMNGLGQCKIRKAGEASTEFELTEIQRIAHNMRLAGWAEEVSHGYRAD